MTRFQEMIVKGNAAGARRRKVVNATMLALTGLLTIMALVPLLWIIGYVILRGG